MKQSMLIKGLLFITLILTQLSCKKESPTPDANKLTQTQANSAICLSDINIRLVGTPHGTPPPMPPYQVYFEVFITKPDGKWEYVGVTNGFSMGESSKVQKGFTGEVTDDLAVSSCVPDFPFLLNTTYAIFPFCGTGAFGPYELILRFTSANHGILRASYDIGSGTIVLDEVGANIQASVIDLTTI